MKKCMGLIVAVVVGFAVLAQADTRTVTKVITNGQAITYSDPIPASGYLEKVEVVQTAGATATVTIATYTGTTAVDTHVSLASLVGNKVVRQKVLGTDNTGTALIGGASTNMTYSYPLIGGNLKMAVTDAGASSTGSNTVTATLYFVPVPR
jgi:hypothetical protein